MTLSPSRNITAMRHLTACSVYKKHCICPKKLRISNRRWFIATCLTSGSNQCFFFSNAYSAIENVSYALAKRRYLCLHVFLRNGQVWSVSSSTLQFFSTSDLVMSKTIMALLVHVSCVVYWRGRCTLKQTAQGSISVSAKLFFFLRQLIWLLTTVHLWCFLMYFSQTQAEISEWNPVKTASSAPCIVDIIV